MTIIHAPSKLEEDVLRVLFQFQYLTIFQIARLLKKESSINYVRERCNHLMALGLIDACFFPRIDRAGRTPRVYFLSREGAGLLSKDASQEKRVSLSRKRSYLPHTLAVNDILIAGTLLEYVEPAIRLLEFRAEHLLRRHPIPISKSTMLMPDGYLHFQLSPPFGERGESITIVFELDRNTEDEFSIQKKITNYLQCINGAYQQEFGLASVTIAFIVAVGGEKRLTNLRRFAGRVFSKQADPADGELFLFTSLDSTPIDPVAFFCGDVWLTAVATSDVADAAAGVGKKPLIEKLY